jgi:hypothetical protein
VGKTIKKTKTNKGNKGQIKRKNNKRGGTEDQGSDT